MEHSALLVAAVLTVFIGVVHSWLGEVRLIGPLLSPQHRTGILANSKFSRNVLRFAWHITTLAWWGFAAVLGWLAITPLDGSSRTVLVMIALTFLATGLVTLISSRGRHLAWIIFVAIAALSVVPIL